MTLAIGPIAAVLWGTLGADMLQGDAQDDFIRGGPQGVPWIDMAPDTLAGGGGNDDVRGYGGDDQTTGGLGNDLLFGGDGNDMLAGDESDDYIDGGAGADPISGGDGNDTIQGGPGIDDIVGGAGNDVITDTAGQTTGSMFGEEGDDKITASAEYIDGGSGKNLLTIPDGLKNSSQFPAVLNFETHDGQRGGKFSTGAHSTTIVNFRPAVDHIRLDDVYYANGTQMIDPDTNSDGMITTSDTGWAVITVTIPPLSPTFNQVALAAPTVKFLRFRGWNSTLYVRNRTSLDIDDFIVDPEG